MSKTRPSTAPKRALEAAPVFAALGDETRLSLVSRLAEGDRISIAGLTEGTEMTRQAVTRHLEVLQDAGLVRGFRRGREHLWELEPERIKLARRSLDQISDWWDNKLAQLNAKLEREARAPR